MSDRYFVGRNPDFGVRGEGQNRFAVYCRDMQARLVLVSKNRTRHGAEAVAAMYNARTPIEDWDTGHDDYWD
jgi:hypothetical protein